MTPEFIALGLMLAGLVFAGWYLLAVRQSPPQYRYQNDETTSLERHMSGWGAVLLLAGALAFGVVAIL